MTDPIDRLDGFESIVQRQAETLDEQTELIERQSDTIAELQRQLDSRQSATGSFVDRRSVLKTGGVLELLFGGVGSETASTV